MENPDRRYTDQEVALVLQRAAEIEEQSSAAPATGRGLTLQEVHAIGREVGFSPEVLDLAVRTVGAARQHREAALLGADLSSKLVRGVPGTLGKSALQQLIQVIEDQVDGTGTVTDALGTVRWTSTPDGHKFSSTTQVSVSSTKGETQIQVVQRYSSRLRALLHLLPGAWGAMIGGGVAASSSVGGTAALALGVVGVAAGVGIGRGIWQVLARRRAKRVEQITTALVAASNDLADG